MQYRLPATSELVPLLHIAPSKTDSERLLVIGPELADVLSAIVCRVRDPDGAVPLVVAYDYHERVFNPPLPILFQKRVGTEYRPVNAPAIRKLLDTALAAAGLTGADGQPLRFVPHDFRRLFITEAVLNGMPPHIAQLVVGHRDINTTMGYKAVYPEEVINGHRAFIARRREQRPSEEYRTPTDEEWEEFLGHFQRRRLSLGDCGRAYGTSCIHEHSCLRCSLLRLDPAPTATPDRHPRQPARPHRRSPSAALARRSRRPPSQPRRPRKPSSPRSNSSSLAAATRSPGSPLSHIAAALPPPSRSQHTSPAVLAAGCVPMLRPVLP